MHCSNFLIYCAPHLSSNHSWFIHQCSLVVAEISSTETCSWWEISLNLADVVSPPCYKRFFNMPLNLRHKPMALFPLLRKSCCGFVSLFEIHLLAEFEHAILVSNGSRANHYTTEKVQVLEMGNNLKLPVHIHTGRSWCTWLILVSSCCSHLCGFVTVRKFCTTILSVFL
jgi:hypothetical protein